MTTSTSSRPAASLPRRHDELRVELHEHGHALRAADGDEVHLLNETAFAIWQLCDGQTSPEEMAAGVCELFGEPGTAVLDDVDRTLSELAHRGLISWAAAKDRP